MESAASVAQADNAQNRLNVSVAPEVWIRRFQWSTALGAGACALTGAGWAYLAFLPALKSSPMSTGGIASLLGYEVMCLAFVAVLARCAIRIPRAALRIGHRGVTIRGVVHTRTLALTQVEGFVAGPLAFSQGALRSAVGIKLRQRKGRQLIVWGLRSSVQTKKSTIEVATAEWQSVGDRLNGLLRAMGGETQPPHEEARQIPTREEADRAYRVVRLLMLASGAWFLVMTAVSVILHFPGWPICVALLVVSYGVIAPYGLRRYRRELNERVKHGEGSLNKPG